MFHILDRVAKMRIFYILLWLKDKIRPNHYDQIISAEIPNGDDDPLLHKIIISNMIHGPCGTFNPSSPCMKDGKCTKHYPREDGYPLYRRRSPEDGGRTVTIKAVSYTHLDVYKRQIVQCTCRQSMKLQF